MLTIIQKHIAVIYIVIDSVWAIVSGYCWVASLQKVLISVYLNNKKIHNVP